MTGLYEEHPRKPVVCEFVRAVDGSNGGGGSGGEDAGCPEVNTHTHSLFFYFYWKNLQQDKQNNQTR